MAERIKIRVQLKPEHERPQPKVCVLCDLKRDAYEFMTDGIVCRHCLFGADRKFRPGVRLHDGISVADAFRIMELAAALNHLQEEIGNVRRFRAAA